ncbi:queuosine precursor transporter [Cytobacillus horneckiae]|uniref:Probable queuosine precursor transporter n=1 Tax=Cytobacillus horneckiae TaxID=549687 RepID=A0A2N0ZCB8_9BACI|nr:queuosine precursor transporter [Cytobacillus horneckiae]MEC1158133.1 queuosine precursor transporter [Cytobacillus horneckiae]MED2936404.1 queuosine precursor transporter [Cytobacillus horneckiae]PKG27162.1 transporter [Cytobacillus horneckiae]
MILYLNGIYVGLLILANIVAVKLFSIGNLAILPAAVVIFIFTYPIIDIIVEVYGKKEGQRTVKAGLITQMLAIIFIIITINLPAAPVFTEQVSFEIILSGSFRVILASLVSYAISQTIVVYVFNHLKMRHGRKKLWLRNNVAVMVSQLADTTIFITIAFYGTMPLSVLGGLIVSQYAFKFIASICITPLVYLVVNFIRRQESVMAEQTENAS